MLPKPAQASLSWLFVMALNIWVTMKLREGPGTCVGKVDPTGKTPEPVPLHPLLSATGWLSACPSQSLGPDFPESRHLLGVLDALSLSSSAGVVVCGCLAASRFCSCSRCSQPVPMALWVFIQPPHPIPFQMPSHCRAWQSPLSFGSPHCQATPLLGCLTCLDLLHPAFLGVHGS